MAMTRSTPHFSNPPRLKQSRIDLPKKPVPPMTRSVDILVSHLNRLAFLAVKNDLPDLASISLRVFPAMVPPCCAWATGWIEQA